jgi:cell division protein FtsQ
LVIEITEQKASALLLMGHLYLVNSEGHIFKRAELAETEGLPIITGLERIDYLNDQEHARQKIIRALTAIQQYNVKPRPQLSEINIGEREEITFYLRHGQAVRLGTKITDEKLQKFDTVWTALGTDASRTRLVFLDHEVRSDRVIVRMNNRSESEGRN